MKKILLLACAGVLCFSQVNAANCREGTEVTGLNGHVYCKGPHHVNWWAAAAWCAAQNRYLATMAEMCPDTGRSLYDAWDGSGGNEKCANLKGVSEERHAVWSRTAFGSRQAWGVTLINGAVHNLTRTGNYFPFCY